jgi:high-affinity iron transporter
MAAGFVVLLRETLEAVLVVTVVLGYLRRTAQAGSARLVAVGVVLGVAASALGAVAFERFAGGFDGPSESTFEGTVMIGAALLLTSMIVWVTRKSSLEQSVERSLTRAGGWGILLLVFLSILREGVESVVFVSAAARTSQGSVLLGASAGVALALLVGILLFTGSLRLRLRPFFAVTNILLILFAAGLVARGVHELQDAGVLPLLHGPLWNLNPPALPDGSLPALHEDGVVGSFAKSLFGYDGSPSLLEAAAYAAYLGSAFLLWGLVSARRSSGAERKATA